MVCILKDKNKILLKIFYYFDTKYKYSKHSILFTYRNNGRHRRIILEYRLFSFFLRNNFYSISFIAKIGD